MKPSSAVQSVFSVPPVSPEPPKIEKGLYFSELLKLSETNLVFCFVGVGSAFSRLNDQTSLIIAKNRKTILVDVGSTIPLTLHRHGMDLLAFDFYHVTHAHADHAGAMEELLFKNRYLGERKTPLIIVPEFAQKLWENTLKGGIEINVNGLVQFNDYIEPISPVLVKERPRHIYEIETGGIHLTFFKTNHITPPERALWSTGLIVDKKVLFTADTRFDSAIFTDLDLTGIETIFHDCQLFNPGEVHATYDELKTLPDSIKERMYLTHYNDNFASFNPVQDGFASFAQPFTPYLWPLPA